MSIDYLKNDLRKEHFKFGSDKSSSLMRTTNMEVSKNVDSEQEKQTRNEEKVSNLKLKQDMRGHHFSYGSSTPLYSSMTNMQFKSYDLRNVSKYIILYLIFIGRTWRDRRTSRR